MALSEDVSARPAGIRHAGASSAARHGAERTRSRLPRIGLARRILALPARRLGVVLAALYLVLIASWSLATPEFGAPDEPSHVARAISVMQGGIVPDRSGVNAPNDPSNLVYIPAQLASDAHATVCFAHQPTVSAACLTSQVAKSGDEAAIHSAAARYEPAYYLAVGWPSAYLHGRAIVWGMRAVSAAICAALLALATIAALRVSRAGHRWVALACVAAVTPTVTFLAGAVNPDSVAVCAGLATWTLGLLAITARGPRRHTALRWWVLAASVMLLARSDSPLWLGLIVVQLAVLARRHQSLPRVRDRRFLAGAAVVVAMTAASLGWTSYARMLVVGAPPGWTVQHANALTAAGDAARHIALWARQAIAGFGWRDTYLPGPAYLAVVGLLAVICLLARPNLAMVVRAVVLVLVALVASVVMQARGYNTLGEWWQGRYVLSLLVGVPLLLSCDGAIAVRPRQSLFRGQLAALAVAIVVALNAGSLLVWLHRSMNGLGHPFHWHGLWAPPIDPRFLVVAAALSSAALVGLAVAAALTDTAGVTDAAGLTLSPGLAYTGRENAADVCALDAVA